MWERVDKRVAFAARDGVMSETKKLGSTESTVALTCILWTLPPTLIPGVSEEINHVTPEFNTGAKILSPCLAMLPDAQPVFGD